MHFTVKNKKVITNNDPEIELDFSEIDPIFCRLLYAMEPFGKGNTKPIFAARGVTLLGARILGKNRNVLKIKAQDAKSSIHDFMLQARSCF